jgi:hypothetical protein
MALKERRGLVELRAKAHGQLRAPATGSTTNVLVNVSERPLTADDHAQALREARLLLEFEADEERDRQALETSPGTTGVVQLQTFTSGGPP